jgi:homoserine O-succinyltransferase
VLQFRYGQKRRLLPAKRWGVYSHQVVNRNHPLIFGVNTRFDVPHSRYNQVDRAQFEAAGLYVLAESEAGVHLAVSEDGFRLVFFQAHPEYDTISLLKEYKREVLRFATDNRQDYPPFPENYFSLQVQAILEEHADLVLFSKRKNTALPKIPEDLIIPTLDNTWHDTAEAILNNWVGKIYQITDLDRRRPFVKGIDPLSPVGTSF